MFFSTTYVSPLGELKLASKDDSLIGLWINGQKYFDGLIKDEFVNNDSCDIFYSTKKWLDEYFEGKNPSLKGLKLNPIGGDFRKAVWNILLEIPYGKLVTYGDIAKQMSSQLGKKTMSAQAVGGAVGHNPISIIIPCHRVVGMGGNLTGYAGGIDTKIKLLTHEGIDISKLYIPKKGTAL